MKLRIVAAVLTIAVLAGCAPRLDPQPTPTTTPTAAREPTPTATPEPDFSDPSTWIIDFDSVGPLALGQPIDEARAAASMFTENEMMLECRVAFMDRPGVPSLALVYWPDDVLSTIIVRNQPATTGSTSQELYASSPKTTAGIGIGSTRDELLAAYPDTSASIDEGYFAVYVIAGSTGSIVVTVNEGIVDSIAADPDGGFAFELC